MSNNHLITYLIWRDADPKKSAREKLVAAIKRHVEKFGTVPSECLVSQIEYDALAPHETIPLRIAPRNFVPRNEFYVGRSKDGSDIRPEGDEEHHVRGVSVSVSHSDSP